MNRRDFFGLFGALGALPFVGRLAKPSIQPAPDPWSGIDLGPAADYSGGIIGSVTSGETIVDSNGARLLWVDELRVSDFVHVIDGRTISILDNPPDSPYEQIVEAEVNHYLLDIEGYSHDDISA